MKRFLVGIGILVLSLIMLGSARAADTSQTIAFRGCDASLAGTVDLRLRLFDAAAGGNMVFEETQTGVAADAAGCVAVQLGAVTPLTSALFNANPSLWVAFALDATPDMELGGGRTPVTANGYAFRATTADRAAQATTADQLGGVPAAGYLQTTGGSLSNTSDTSVVSVTNTGSGSALAAASQNATGVAGLFQNTAGGDLVQGQSSGGATVFRLLNTGGAVFNGNVGIGQPNPQDLLHVGPGGSPFPGIRLTSGVGVNLLLQAGLGGASIATLSNDPLFFNTNGLLGPKGMTLDTNGNVGIGTTSPGDILHVKRDQIAPSSIILENANGGPLAYAQILLKNNTATVGGIWRNSSTQPNYGGPSSINFGSSQAINIGFTTSNVNRMLINANGNVGIGTTNPTAAKLVVNDANIGTGVAGISSIGSGVFGQSTSASGWGVYGDNTAGGFAGFFNGKVQVNGSMTAKVVQITGADFSEKFEVHHAQKTLEPGLVVTIDPDHPGKLAISAKAYDRRVAGILSGAGGINPGMLMGQPGTLADGDRPVALSGRVYVWADASNGAIVPGDLLTTSNVPGHAMKVTNYSKAQGATLGKAMTGLAKGRGLVLVLVTLQ